MDKSEKIYIAGHSGMVGSALIRLLERLEYDNLLFRTHSELDLMDQKAVSEFFVSEKPDYIFLAAAKVGGILANNNYRGQFLYENLMIQNNIIQSAHEVGVKKLLFLGSACIYPRNAPQPIKEEYLLTNILEFTNEPYAIAKIAGVKLCENYYRQFNDNFISIMPNNLFGPNDNFDLKTSHVLPACLRKMHEANMENYDFVEIWGSGNPLREFLHVDDLADACVFLMKNLDAKALCDMNISHINVGSGDEVTIKELALLIKNIIGFEGKLKFNKNYPDGVPRKMLDVSRLDTMGWKSKINLENGIKSVYNWYLNESQYS